MTLVVKVGGHALDDLRPRSAVLGELAQDLGEMLARGERVVLVHGGGPQIAELLGRLGMASRFVDGLRVTDQETMRVVVMAMAEVNTAVVAALSHAGVPCVGLNGADATLFAATSLGPPWDRAAGAPRVRADVVGALLDAGYVPVVSSVSVDENGDLLNCNADAAAGGLARALDAQSLVLLSDVDQIRRDPDDPTTAQSRLSVGALRELVDSGAVREGMRPKALAALAALDEGAASVLVANGTRAHALRRALAGEIPTTEVHA